MLRNEFPSVTVIESGGNLGFGKAHNLIARHSSEPFVLFLNPDTQFVESAHEQMLKVFQAHPEVGVLGCRMTNLDGTLQPLGFQSHTSPWTEFVHGLFVSRATLPIARRFLAYHDPLVDGFVRKLYGGCLLVRRDVMDKVGWFDERFFMYGEDVDLSRRIEAAGWRLYYLSTTRIIHLCGGASAKAPGRFATLMQCESISKLMEKYYGSSGRRRYVAAVFLRASLRISLLSAFRILQLLRPKQSENIEDSWRKNLALLRWALGKDRAVIPG
jgi:GT2 family glycosyltransferase